LSRYSAASAAAYLGHGYKIRHEREEAFRERLITAADDFSTGLLQAIIGLETARTTCVDRAVLYPPDTKRLTFRDPNTGVMPAESAEALGRSRELIREVEARRARISLLFGPVSLPDSTATIAVITLEEAQRALEDRPFLISIGTRSKCRTRARITGISTARRSRKSVADPGLPGGGSPGGLGAACAYSGAACANCGAVCARPHRRFPKGQTHPGAAPDERRRGGFATHLG
jgi:hypothetical protein